MKSDKEEFVPVISQHCVQPCSGCQVAVLAPVVLIEPQPKLDYIIRIQQQAGPYEPSM